MNQVEQEIKAYAAKRRKERRRERNEQGKRREVLRSKPLPCSNCAEVKPTHILNPPTCSACYIYSWRYGRPRPVVQGGAL